MTGDKNKSRTGDDDRLPILIAGAGPCGLATALCLQQEKVPFLLLEKASRPKLCSDVGSGFDLAPTAYTILLDHMKVPNISPILSRYAGVYFCTNTGKVIRDEGSFGVSIEKYASVHRADLQRVLLDAIVNQDKVLKCGAAIESYKVNNDQVIVTLSDGSKVQGSVLLGCDGINSAVRKQMHTDDPLHFCDMICYWGKCPIEGDSNPKLQDLVKQTQSYPQGASMVSTLAPTKDHPGIFICVPTNGYLTWTYLLPRGSDDTSSNDLTRRGGVMLDAAAKEELLKNVSGEGCYELIRVAMESTDASLITQVGLYDREKLNVAYVDGPVALLGDSAHPQSPMMGQGLNQALTDAYVCAMRLAKAYHSEEKSMSQALVDFDSPERKQGVTNVILQARSNGSGFVSTNFFMRWLMRLMMGYMPMSWLAADMIAGDSSNAEFLKKLDEDYPSEE